MRNGEKAGAATPQNIGGGEAAEETGQRLKPECEKSLNAILKGGEKKPPELGKQGSDKIKTVMRNKYCNNMHGTEQDWWQGAR